jgi:hypothetical protein
VDGLRAHTHRQEQHEHMRICAYAQQPTQLQFSCLDRMCIYTFPPAAVLSGREATPQHNLSMSAAVQSSQPFACCCPTCLLPSLR